MTFETMTLRELMDAMERKTFLETHMRDMQWRIDKKTYDCNELKYQLEQEEADVLELQTGGIHAFFKTVFRDRNEILEKERLEAAQAGAKYEMAMTDLAKMKEELEGWKAELASLEGCEEAFRSKYDAQKKNIAESGNEAAQKMLLAEEQLAKTRGRLREIQEASRAASSALAQVETIEKSLRSAENWGTFDMLGGGTIASVVKRGHMNDAEQMIPELQRRLQRLSDELEDVSIRLDHTIEHGEFLRFADWFFDGIFVDWMVQDKIHNFQSEIAQVKYRIQSTVMGKLNQLRNDTERDIQRLEREIEALVMEA